MTMPQADSTEVNRRYTPDGQPESKFRQQIRDILDLDWSTRDQKIYDELRRLKGIETALDSIQQELSEARESLWQLGARSER